MPIKTSSANKKIAVKDLFIQESLDKIKHKNQNNKYFDKYSV